MDFKFSIVIPYHTTSNTMHFIKRQLNYYHINSIPMTIVVAVSGDEILKVELEQFIKKLNDPRFVIFTTNENDIKNVVSFVKKIFDALKLVTTPYVVINGADDVILPEAACEGIEVLSNNPDIAAVKGHTIYFNCISGKILISQDLEIIDNFPINRLKLAIKDRDSIFYIIRRTKDLVREYGNIVSLSKTSKIVSNSLYHIEHFKALSVASLGKVCIFKSPWRLQSSHKNNHTSHTNAAFVRVELGVVDKTTYEWFKSVNKNMHDLSYNIYKFLWEFHQIRGISVTLKQIAYNYIYKNCSLITSIRILIYFILNKILVLLQKCFDNKPGFFYNAEDFFKTEQYDLLKKYYFSENDIKLIESNINFPLKTN